MSFYLDIWMARSMYASLSTLSEAYPSIAFRPVWPLQLSLSLSRRRLLRLLTLLDLVGHVALAGVGSFWTLHLRNGVVPGSIVLHLRG
jgi:hypothetical protein